MLVETKETCRQIQRVVHNIVQNSSSQIQAEDKDDIKKFRALEEILPANDKNIIWKY